MITGADVPLESNGFFRTFSHYPAKTLEEGEKLSIRHASLGSLATNETRPTEPGVNILLVDDHPENLLSLEVILGDMNLNLVKAASGEEALRQVLRQDFALILLDVRLPDIDGFEVAQLIRERERSRHIPIIFLTAYAASDEQILRSYSVGGVDYTVKPFIPEILKYKVGLFVDLFRKTEALRRLNETLEHQVAKRTAQLQRAEEKYRSLFEHAVEGIFQTTLNGGYLIVANPAMAHILGYETPEQLLANIINLDELYIDANRRAAFRRLLQKNQFVSGFESQVRRRDGSLIWISENTGPFYDASGQLLGYESLVQDITERKLAEEKLRITNQQLQELTDRLQEELTLAQKIQQSLLPTGRPSWSGLDIICHSVPAREVGGDFYAYHAFKDDGTGRRFAVAVGDVSGKGMPAALLMAASLSALQSIIAQAYTPSDLLTELNLALKPYTKTTLQNCALCYAEITPPTSEQPEGCLRVANAGCVPPLICRANGEVEWVEVGGLPLGVGLSTHLGYDEAIFSLKAGDLVIFTSDGVVEATDVAGNLFSFERLELAVAKGPRGSATTMLAYLQSEITNFTGNTESHDDLTIVVVQV
jgi:PAS domain S-box-containing protein